MVTRRTFLWGAGASAAMFGAPRLEAQPQADLPPALQALTSMKSQARPITADERRGRVEKARRLMAEEKIDALMLCSGMSLIYFTNIRWSGGERLFTCVVPAKGEPFFVCPAFEEDRAREQIALGPFAGTADVGPPAGVATTCAPASVACRCPPCQYPPALAVLRATRPTITFVAFTALLRRFVRFRPAAPVPRPVPSVGPGELS